MIGHTGFLDISRAMAPGFEALRKRDRVTKDTSTDIDSLTEEQREAQIEELELRDISDHKLRKVLRDLDRQRFGQQRFTGTGRTDQQNVTA